MKPTPALRPLVRAALRAPAPLRLGQRPRNDRGVPLDAQTSALIELNRRSGQPRWDEMGAERGRPLFDASANFGDLPPVPLARIEDRRFEGPGGPVPVRIYSARRDSAPQPTLIYFHGGGFVLGGLDSHDGLCRHLAASAELLVISVDYRLAPEHPFPAAADDAIAATEWVHQEAESLGVDPAWIAVGGDSAGGNLAAVVCQARCDQGLVQPALQALIYPSTDMTRSAESHRHFASGFFLEQPTLDWFLASYLRDHREQTLERASPLLRADLAGLAPAHVMVAGFDPLRDEGEAYARGLMAAGVACTLRSYESLVHGFVSMGGLIDASRHAIEDLATVLRSAVRRASA